MTYNKKKYTREDTPELCRRIQESKDAEAMEVLIRLHERLVQSIVNSARHLRTGIVEEDDLIQCGRIGLIKAAIDYDPEKGAFSTYAVWKIMSELQKGTRDIKTTVRIPQNTQDDIAKVNRSAEKYPEKNPYELIACVANDIGFPKAKVTFLLTVSHSFCHITSLDIPVNASGDNFLMDFIPDDKPDIGDAYCKAQARTWIDNMMENIRPREKIAVTLRYGLDGGEERTYDEIAKVLGVTKERARQIEAHALRTMRWHARGQRDILECITD